jgi:hypothetical protein
MLSTYALRFPGNVAMFRYFVSGLQVSSDVELRSAVSIDTAPAADLSIRRADLRGFENASRTADLAAGRFRFKVDLLGKFLIQNGCEIFYEPSPGIDPTELAVYLLGTCLAAALQQRGHFVLHASAVSIEGKAMLFCGTSGAGKSTMVAMLGRRGYPLLNDDICNLRHNKEGDLVVCPDGRMLKLWTASLEELNQAAMGAPILTGLDKFYTSPRLSDSAERPVSAVYVLQEAQAGESPSITPLPLAQAMAALWENAYRPELVTGMDQQRSYFEHASALCRQARICRLRRPKDFSAADALMNLLEDSWTATPASAL